MRKKEKNEQLLEIEENIKNLENEKKEEIRKANVKEAKLKDDINNLFIWINFFAN